MMGASQVTCKGKGPVVKQLLSSLLVSASFHSNYHMLTMTRAIACHQNLPIHYTDDVITFRFHFWLNIFNIVIQVDICSRLWLPVAPDIIPGITILAWEAVLLRLRHLDLDSFTRTGLDKTGDAKMTGFSRRT